jgi:hypothetical protein
VAPTIAAGGMTAAFVVADGAAASAAQAAPAAAVGMATASATDFARLRQCESGGRYTINSGNGYYGAYQFDARTWRGLGYSGLPHQAAPAVQDDAAAKLQSQRGWQPWPGCARKLGLTSGRGSYTPQHAAPVAKQAAPKRAATKPAAKPAPRKVAPVEAAPKRASRTRTLAPRTAPPLDRVMTLADRSSYRLVVAQWQARMAERGWQITVDGHFGPQSARIAERFAKEKGLASTPAGTVDGAVMAAAWTAPLDGAGAPATPTAIPGALLGASTPGL